MAALSTTETSEYVGFAIISLVFNGIYIYEFMCFGDFDWRLLAPSKDSQERSSLLAKAVKATYILCRYCSLISSATELYILFRISRKSLLCEATFKLATGTAFLAGTFSSALIAARAAVVWFWDVRVTALLSSVLLAVIATDIRIYFILTSSYDPTNRLCSLERMYSNLPNIAVLLICDFVILGSLLAGLDRWHRPGRGLTRFRLWSMLWNQGVLYLALASALEIPSFVFLLLNLDPIMDTMLMRPMVIILVIATTRFYKSLNTFAPNQTRDDFTNTICFAAAEVGTNAGFEDGIALSRW